MFTQKILLNVSHCIPFFPPTNILERKYFIENIPAALPFNTPHSHGHSDPGVGVGGVGVEDVEDHLDRVMHARLDTLHWPDRGSLQESWEA